MTTNSFVVPQDVIERAVNLMVALVQHAKGWPEDDWFCIGPDWDLNLYQSDSKDNAWQATLYPVVKGVTKTAQGHPLAPAKVLADRGLAILK